MIKKFKEFFSNINWVHHLHKLLFIVVAGIIVISVWLTLSNINNRVYREKESIAGRVLIDVSVSDTLTRGIDDKLNRVLQELLLIKQDSVAVEVRKIQNTKVQ